MPFSYVVEGIAVLSAVLQRLGNMLQDQVQDIIRKVVDLRM
jgi:hypothetical protein